MLENKDNIEDAKKEIVKLQLKNKELEVRLKQIEKERTEYLQNISHQLVAPLNAIKWHIENLTENRIGVVRAEKVLRSIYSQATIAVHLAKNFNLMSNLESDHNLTNLKEPLQEIELRRLLVNIANDFQPLAWDQNINISVRDENFDKEPSVFAIKPLIGQVFSNIIENAIKYSDRDTSIIIEGKYLKENDSFVVTISNQGIVLSPDYASKIFERGFRSEEAKQKYPAGTGFGLYIALKIVEIHEGTIQGSSKGNQTTFIVTLFVQKLKEKAREYGQSKRTNNR